MWAWARVMIEAVLREAERRCAEDALAEQRSYGVLPPCRSIDPLWPPLSLAECASAFTDSTRSFSIFSPLYARSNRSVGTLRSVLFPHLVVVVAISAPYNLF